MAQEILRSVPLDDIDIQRGGDGRTVVAYATPFGIPTEVIDMHGHYFEVVRHSAFDKTIAENFGSVQVFYNHGKTIHGTPSERYSMPIGTPIEITPDAKGLKTVTRYAQTPLADEVLESIRAGSLRSMSYTARIVRSSDPRRLPGHTIPTVERVELALREYGPTPLPVNTVGADILAIRSSLLDDPAVFLDQLSDDERALLLEALNTSTLPAAPPEEGTPPGAPESDTLPAAPPEEGTPPGAPSIVDRLLLEQAQRRRVS